jgi:uncharacterized protein YndB with AHSA1/START domain
VTARSVVHDTFVIERYYEAAPARVWAAWSDPAAKGRWFVGPDEWSASAYSLDFRVGGLERNSGGPPGGPVHHYQARYLDIVPGRRIIIAYDMRLGDDRISVSLATVELAGEGSGTRLRFTEQGAFLDGHDDAGGRRRGTELLLDQLGAALAPRN